MISSFALIFLVGCAMAAICAKIGLPRIVGMLITGVVIGPYLLDFLAPSVLGISSELRQIALIIILIKAGLSLSVRDLKRVGRPAILLSFLPAVFETAGVMIAAPLFLHLGLLEAALLGAVLAAVSPAVVVPRMVQLTEEGYGTDKSIPQMLLAGASLDDVFVIVVFTTLLGMAQGDGVRLTGLLDIPVSVLLGIALGIAAGFVLAALFEYRHRRGASVRQSEKVILMTGTAFLLMTAETWLEGRVALSGLLAVMSMACTVQMRCRKEVSADLSEKYGKLWLAAEVILFVLVGAAVDIRYTLGAGIGAVATVLIALVFRCAGVFVCLIGTPLNNRERLYCMIAYLPKATVQAAIGSVPLSMGLACGNTVLSVAVVSILITAPLGAIAMDRSYRKLLCKTPAAEADR